ncbi:Pathogen effector ECP2 [Teratosphaeria destructans]|uniref:Pathogen effector ECP2 n=1 Tax=Teratosphaeria destructans TaxID=418781 RepID=A0A9W7VZC3_9PEZI|nr:Pathogen effector ECP2 [Teratosphaeria destructans]
MRFDAALVYAIIPAFAAATTYIKYDYVKGGRVLEPADPHTPNIGNNPGDKNAGKGHGNNECDVSSFMQLTQNGTVQPLIEDCTDMLTLIEEDESWEIDCTGVTIVSYKTCAFNAKVAEGYCDKCALLGNGDVHDVAEDSIDRYGGKNGTLPPVQGTFGLYINSAGEMMCDSPSLPQGQQVLVDWTLTHS